MYQYFILDQSFDIPRSYRICWPARVRERASSRVRGKIKCKVDGVYLLSELISHDRSSTYILSRIWNLKSFGPGSRDQYMKRILQVLNLTPEMTLKLNKMRKINRMRKHQTQFYFHPTFIRNCLVLFLRECGAFGKARLRQSPRWNLLKPRQSPRHKMLKRIMTRPCGQTYCSLTTRQTTRR